MKCLICGNELNTCLCPRCGFDLSRCRELFPTLADDGRRSRPSWGLSREQNTVPEPQPLAADRGAVIFWKLLRLFLIFLLIAEPLFFLIILICYTLDDVPRNIVFISSILVILILYQFCARLQLKRCKRPKPERYGQIRLLISDCLCLTLLAVAAPLHYYSLFFGLFFDVSEDAILICSAVDTLFLTVLLAFAGRITLGVRLKREAKRAANGPLAPVRKLRVLGRFLLNNWWWTLLAAGLLGAVPFYIKANGNRGVYEFMPLYIIGCFVLCVVIAAINKWGVPKREAQSAASSPLPNAPRQR